MAVIEPDEADVEVAEAAETADAMAASAPCTVCGQCQAIWYGRARRAQDDALLIPVAASFSIVVARLPPATESAPFASRPAERERDQSELRLQAL